MSTDLTAADWAAMRATLMYEERATTHWDGCWTKHRNCRTLLALDALARQQEANARLTAELKQALEAHAASFGALATLSAALGDGEVDDYDALAQHAIDTVADRDATIARLREALDRVLPIFDTHRKIGEAMGLSENLIVTPAKEADRG
jgi:hypothetical protein